MPIHSPRSPHNMGFVPLSTSHSNNYQESGIPLTNVRSKASSTGVRSANQGAFQNVDMSDGNGTGEKQGLFSRHGAAGRRRQPKGIKRHDTDPVSVNAMGRLYNKIVGFSVVTRYLVYVLPIALLLGVPLILLPITGDEPDDGRDRKDRITLGDVKDDDGNTIHGPSLFKLFLWIEISWLTLWAGKLVAQLLPPIFMFFCGVVSSGTRKYATVLRALEIPLSLFFWALASWLVFTFFFPNDRFGWVLNLKRVLLALFISSAVLLAEKTIVQLISITYHQRSFANRIKHSKREVYLVGLMYDASRKLFPMYCPEFSDEDYIINDSIDMILARSKGGHKRGGSVNPMKLIGDVGRFGDKLTSVFGNIASEITGKQVFNPNSAHSIVVEALEKVRSSEAMARRIWMSFVVEDRDSLSVDDIIEVLGPDFKEEAEECFAAIDADQNGDISLEEMVRKIVEIGKERKAIAHSMKDISQALAVFDRILLFVVALIVILIFLACFQSSFITTLTTAGTALLSISFVFAVTAQEFLGSCIFLFVKHPFDVADRVDIQGPDKQQLIVEKISLLYTVFTRIDKMQIVQVPNIQLNNLWIENVTRSNAMREIIEVNVSYDTSFEDLELLRVEMEKFVRAPENARDFQPDININVGGVGDLDKLNLKVAIKHKSNWHNDTVRATRRSKFMCALALAIKRIPIYAPGGGGDALGGPSNPAYSVAVTDAFASEARSRSTENKEAARMVPSASAKSADVENVEQTAAADLNQRNALAEAVDEWGYDNTLNSRDVSSERRQNDVDSMRRDMQSFNRESQRGRRKAGEGLPAAAMEEYASNTTTRTTSEGAGGSHATTQYSSRHAGPSFDVESQPGAGGPALGPGGNPATYGVFPPNPAAYGIAPPNPAAYGVFPPQSRYSPPGSSEGMISAAAVPAPPPPALGYSASASASTSRGRSGTVSRAQQGQGQGQGLPPGQGRPGPSQY